MVFQSFLNFDTFLFPKLTTIIYWIGLVVIGLVGVIGFFGAIFGDNNWLGAFGALIAAAVLIVIWRITVELWMVIFSIYDVLRDIRDGRRG